MNSKIFLIEFSRFCRITHGDKLFLCVLLLFITDNCYFLRHVSCLNCHKTTTNNI